MPLTSLKNTIGISLMAFLLLACYDKNNLPLDSPKVQIKNASLSLISKEPDIVTPTGVQVDAQKRIWVIENHTHVRQDDYPGPRVDRILVFSGYLEEGAERKITEFATDFIDGMSLSFSPSGSILISTRASIMEFIDEDGDLVADRRDTLIGLETAEKFPHNGMSGLAVRPDGKLFFQCGENFGSEYTLTGTDGKVIYGKEREGGSLYTCDADGSNLERIGRAVWNCFAMTFDDFGNLFAVENDPDSRPPCRLLHIVKGGNYGFQFQHGRDGLSPLTSWFGQIPGTLPMVAGTGEAPSGVLYYNQDKLGANVQNSLLVTAWGDNEIQSFQLKPKGSSFTAEAKSFVKGVRNFYPVGLAIDDRGGVIATDWADVSYAVHGQGRIWRIANPDMGNNIPWVSNESTKEQLLSGLASADPRIRLKAADLLVEKHEGELDAIFSDPNTSPPSKMNLIWAAHRAEYDGFGAMLSKASQHENELLRAAAVRTMLEENVNTDESYYLNLVKNDASAYVKREAIYGLKSKEAFARAVELFGEKDPFVHAALIESFGKEGNLSFLLDYSRNENAATRLGALLCLRNSEVPEAKSVIPAFLQDEDTDIRTTVLKWVAEDRLREFRGEVEISLNSLADLSKELFDAYVVTFQYLDGEFNQKAHFMEGDSHISQTFYKRQKFLLTTAKNAKLNFEIRARALSGINPVHEELSYADLEGFANSPNKSFQIETVRSLGSRIEDVETIGLLQQIAKDDGRDMDVRQEAIVGLANSLRTQPESRNFLMDLASNESEARVLKEEAIRSLHVIADEDGVGDLIESYTETLPEESRAGDLEFWRGLAEVEGDEIDGARTFFSARYQCANCHRIDGRGGIFGPDLSQVGSNANLERIVESILNPSDIVTPTYTGYAVTDKEGKITLGRLDKALDSKRHLQMILATGERARVAYDEIEEQKMMPTSLMPANLHRTMTADEFTNLIQYLSEIK